MKRERGRAQMCVRVHMRRFVCLADCLHSWQEAYLFKLDPCVSVETAPPRV